MRQPPARIGERRMELHIHLASLLVDHARGQCLAQALEMQIDLFRQVRMGHKAQMGMALRPGRTSRARLQVWHPPGSPATCMPCAAGDFSARDRSGGDAGGGLRWGMAGIFAPPACPAVKQIAQISQISGSTSGAISARLITLR